MMIVKEAPSKPRESSIELLRLLLMFMIVVHHAIVHGLGLSGFSPQIHVDVVLVESEYPLFMSVNSLCICAVNCFILVSGFFGIRFTALKFGKLLFAVIFYTLVFYVPYNVIEWGGVAKLLYSLMFLSHSPYWFIVDYLLLMAFAPMLNVMFEYISKRNVKFILGTMIFVSCYLGFIWQNNTNPMGYNLFQFVTMYCGGRYLCLYVYEKIKWTKLGWLGIYVLLSLLNAMLMYILAEYGRYGLAWRMTFYNNPFVMLAGLSLFMVFKQIHFHSRFVNNVSASALAVYLFQSSPYVADRFYNLVRSVAQEGRMDDFGWGLLGSIMLISVVVVVVSLCFDKVRMHIWDIILRKLYYKKTEDAAT